jgi:hypothetical protein
LLVYDNARHHSSVSITKAMMPHPSYIPDLTPLDCYLLGPLKEELMGHHYGNDDTVKTVGEQQGDRPLHTGDRSSCSMPEEGLYERQTQH